jgi:nicotinamide-nucleotide amidase
MPASAPHVSEGPVSGGANPVARAGIVVTGTEVLTGRVTDRNGPWLADRLRDEGIDLAHVMIVGDRREDMIEALRFMASRGMDLVITSGGLGPTADDLTAEVVGGFQGREMVLDEPLEGRIAKILEGIAKRWPNLDMEAIREGNRKQAMIPRGAAILEPVGTAPGLVVPPSDGRVGPTVVVLPGPPRELQPMWGQALQTPELAAVLASATVYHQRTLRLFGIPESEIAETLRIAEREGVALGRIEVTTCLKRAEVEVVTRYEPDAEEVYGQLAAVIRRRHADSLFSDDGRTVDELVAARLRGDEGGAPLTVAVGESCTGGLLAARITDQPGSSAYFQGSLVTYSNAAKETLAGVPDELIAEHGAVSAEVAQALADGARAALGADVGIGVTGIAGPGGGTAEKPVGLVWLCVSRDGATEPLLRSVNLPGGRADIRERATTVALHLLRRSLAEA